MASETVQTPSLEGVQWVDGTSKNGVTFQTSLPPTDAEVSESTKAEGSDSTEDGPKITSVKVHWTVSSSLAWRETSQEVKNLGISRYRLWHALGEEPKYVLEFTNTKGWGFSFTDESNDTYFCSTPLNRDHMISYISDQPTIVEVA